jgi:methyl-accepting chemotaxis protein
MAVFVFTNINVTKDSSENLQESELKLYKNQVKTYVEYAYMSAYKHYNYVKNEDEKTILKEKEFVIDEIRNFKFINDIDYVWIIDNSKPYPNMIMEPLFPSLDGENLNNDIYNTYTDKNGDKLNVFKEIVNNVNKKEYIEYNWPIEESEGFEKLENKISYIKEFKEWNWIFGSGFYLKNINEDLEKSESFISGKTKIYILYFSIVYFICMFILISLIYRYLTNVIFDPVHEIIAYLTDISNGNLNTNNTLKFKGIFELNLIKRHLKDTIGDLSIMINKINNKSVFVYQSFMETKMHIDELKTNLNDISVTTEELTSSVEETAATTEEMSTILEEIKNSSSKIISDIKLMYNKTNNIDIDSLYNSTEDLHLSINNMVKGVGEVALVNTQNAEATGEISKNISDILFKAEDLSKNGEKLRQTAFELMETIGYFKT